MSDKTTENAAAETSQPNEIKMKLGTGGSQNFTIDDFNRAAGVEVEDLPGSEDDEEEPFSAEDEEDDSDEDAESDDSEGEDDDSEEDDEDGEDEDGDSDDAEEDDEEADDEDDDSDSEGGESDEDVNVIIAKAPDGSEYEIPENLVIQQKVDGEMREITVRDYLDGIAGTETIHSRLGQIASLKEEMSKTLEANNRQLQARFELDQKMMSKIASGDMFGAFVALAEAHGDMGQDIDPVELSKAFMSSAAATMKKFRGRPQSDVEAYWSQMRSNWLNHKLQKREMTDKQRSEFDTFANETAQMLEEKGIPFEVYHTVHSNMKKQGQLDGITDKAEVRATVLRTTVLARRAARMKYAIDEVNPKLENDGQLIRRLEKAVDFGDYSDEELVELVKEYAQENNKQRASNLSRKAKKAKAKAQPEKKSDAKAKKVLEGKKLKSMEDLNKAFGFSY